MVCMTSNTRQRAMSAPASAAQLVDALRSATARGEQTTVEVNDRVVALPRDLTSQLIDLLEDVSEGRDVTSAPAGLPVGTELASELLGVSRPWLTTLLDRGEIASIRVGSKRRMRLGDILAYRRTDDARRRQGLSWEFLDEGA
jgi:excisionase family DNA binding protein